MAKTGKRALAAASVAATGSTTATDAAATLKKKAGSWMRSAMKTAHIEAYQCDRWLPSAEELQVRVPGNEVSPQTREGERVCFHDFVNRGFSFPVTILCAR